MREFRVFFSVSVETPTSLPPPSSLSLFLACTHLCPPFRVDLGQERGTKGIFKHLLKVVGVEARVNVSSKVILLFQNSIVIKHQSKSRPLLFQVLGANKKKNITLGTNDRKLDLKAFSVGGGEE